MTMIVMDILDVVMSAPPDSPAWGLMICEATGHGPSSIYPALERLLKASLRSPRKTGTKGSARCWGFRRRT
jgi:hypothetical protein